jgi:hypothetical protein
VGSAGHVVLSNASGPQKVIALVFMLGREQYGFDKKCVRRRYAELVILHPVGSVGHVVHSGSSKPRNVIALFLILMLEWYRFDKKHAGTHYV